MGNIMSPLFTLVQMGLLEAYRTDDFRFILSLVRVVAERLATLAVIVRSTPISLFEDTLHPGQTKNYQFSRDAMNWLMLRFC